MRARRRRIGFIGRIDPDETMVDGQTVKTRTLYRYLVRRFGASSVRAVDTRESTKIGRASCRERV